MKTFACLSKLGCIAKAFGIGNKARKAKASTKASNLDRRDFEAIRAIPDQAFKDLLVSYFIPRHRTKQRELCRVLARDEGSYNHVVKLALFHDGSIQQYIIRVPAHGTAENWTEEDAYMMRCEAELMKYIRRQTSVPVPEIVAYETSSWNEIHAPFILMKRLPGKPAENLWFDEPVGDEVADTYGNADVPSEETERKRLTLLRSLARTMAELQKLEFDKIGFPVFEVNMFPFQNRDNAVDASRPSIGHSFHWHDHTRWSNIVRREPFASSKDYFAETLVEKWNDDLYVAEVDDSEYSKSHNAGMRKVLEIVFSTPAFTTSKSSAADEHETFVLRHPDFDLQNILTDDEGNVTGIIDWDGCMAVPRCIGPASLPLFLHRDWLPYFSFDSHPYMSWSLDHYRNVFTREMKDLSCNDADYTPTSGIHQAAMGVLHEGHPPLDFITKILKHLPGFHHDEYDAFLLRLGRGWPAAEAYLQREISSLLRLGGEQA